MAHKKGHSDLDIFAPGGFADRLKNQTLGPAKPLGNQTLGNQRLALFDNEPPKKKRRRTITF